MLSVAPQASEQDSVEPRHDEASLSWDCAFCGRLRVFEGGRPFDFGRLDTCAACGSRIAAKPADRVALAALIDNHLL
jgi:hypothetical protein